MNGIQGYYKPRPTKAGKIQLDIAVAKLTDDNELKEKIKDRIRKNKKTSSRLQYENNQLNHFVFVDETEFYHWIQETYPEFKSKIPSDFRFSWTQSFRQDIQIVEGTTKTADELYDENLELQRENTELKKQLEEANKKLANWGRKKEFVTPTGKK